MARLFVTVAANHQCAVQRVEFPRSVTPTAISTTVILKVCSKMYASHFNWLQVSFRRTSLSSTGFESRKGERFPRAQGRRYLPVSASILLYFESLILNPTLRGRRPMFGRTPSMIGRRDKVIE